MVNKPLVFFIHGLNTYGDNLFHLGPLALGPMNANWKRELIARGCDFEPIDEMGFGSFEDQVERAVRKILRTLDASTETRDVHLFGHSMGGLVARGAGSRLQESSEFRVKARLRSIITLGTPHEGTRATEGALDLQKQNPGLYRFLRLFGYDIEERRDALQYFTKDRIRAFAERHPILEGVDCVSLVGAAQRRRLGVPMQIIYRRLHPRGEEDLSDGLVEASAQKWGRVAGVFELDHGAELGAFTQIDPRERRFARREFERLVETVLGIVEANGSK